MSKETANKTIVEQWFKRFWGNPYDESVLYDLAAPDILFHYPMHGPIRGRDAVREMVAEFRAAFPDLNFWGVGDLIAEGDYVVGRWDGGGTHTGPAFKALPVGSLPAKSGRKMKFTGTTVLKLKNGKIIEEIGEEGALTALQQLGLVQDGNWPTRSAA